MAKNWMGENSLRALTRIIKTQLAEMNLTISKGITEEEVNALITAAMAGTIKTTDIVDNLTSTDNNKALSANQGHVLDGKIETVDGKVETNAGKIADIEASLSAIDTDGDGVVNHAETADKLDGHTADYFATAESLEGKISTSEKGVANGIAVLDENGQIPSANLPSYVDDVIEGYYFEGKFYASFDGSTYTDEIEGERGKIYLDLNTNMSYRYGGTQYTKIVSDDAVELSDEEIAEIWNSTTID